MASNYYRIDVEYFILYHDVKHGDAEQTIANGLSNNLAITATYWGPEQSKIIKDYAKSSLQEIKHQLPKLPVSDLKKLPSDIESTKRTLANNPHSPHCHFHLAWLYSAAKDHPLAERHFNIAALQSQAVNQTLSCFAFRHLAHTRRKMNKLSQALQAIEAATKLSQYYDPELQFEHISLLVRTQKTTLALSILDQLISKNPQYEIIVNKDAELQEDPLLNRYLQQLKDNHLKGIQHKLREHWEEHPLSLLNLDKGLGQKNSHIALQKQQHKMLSNLPPLLQTNEALSSRLIQKYSHSIIADSLDKRKQQYINKIEAQKAYTNRAYKLAQWMLYATVLCLIALGLSYVVSAIAHQFDYYWPINSYIQSVVLGSAIGLLILGTALLQFRPRKLTDLLKQKDQLEELSLRFSTLTR